MCCKEPACDGRCKLCCSLAKSQQLDQDGLMAIFTQYGDHLYAKGDHDGAIQQYIRTIGKLEASYVIRKVRGCVLSSVARVLFSLLP